jgi:hypothetical protein
VKVPAYVQDPRCKPGHAFIFIDDVAARSDLALDIIERRVKRAWAGLSLETYNLARYWGITIVVGPDGKFTAKVQSSTTDG